MPFAKFIRLMHMICIDRCNVSGACATVVFDVQNDVDLHHNQINCLELLSH